MASDIEEFCWTGDNIVEAKEFLNGAYRGHDLQAGQLTFWCMYDGARYTVDKGAYIYYCDVTNTYAINLVRLYSDV